MRKITYCEAINEALHQEMEADESLILIGQGVTSPWYVGGTCRGLLDRFGSNRVIDTPISENSITGSAIGAALAGLKPILVFPRMDFMMYAMDPIINHAAKWHYMFGGRAHVPLVIWTIMNAGGCQGAQHSQEFTWLFAGIAGLKTVSPGTPQLAKGLMKGAIEDPNPVVYIDDRARYEIRGNVPEEKFAYDIDKHTLLGWMFIHNWTRPVPCSKVLEREYYRRKEEHGV